jgi:1-acyl-sn-glycerol-3-phosphate acyltransferase
MDLSFWQNVVFPLMERTFTSNYFSFETRGFESGPVIFAANHSGWFPLDGLFFCYAAATALGPEYLPHGVAHDVLLKVPVLGDFFNRLGAVPASWFRDPENIPEALSMAVFPEGSEGNFKPFWSAYRTREWKRGFVRYALARRAAILPVAILGGEESLPVLAKISFLKPLIKTDVPLPLSLVPFPSSWKVIVHPPILVDAYGPEAVNDSALCRKLAEQAQSAVQETIRREKEGSLLWRLSKAFPSLRGGGATGNPAGQAANSTKLDNGAAS